MEYVVKREIETGECLTLYFVAECMAYADSNVDGHIYLQDVQEKIDAYMERFLSDARRGQLRLTDHYGRTKSVDEIITSIPSNRLLSDDLGRRWSEEKLEIYTFLPMLNDWGQSFGYSFVFAKDSSEVTIASSTELTVLGRKIDNFIKPPQGMATLQEAADWLTQRSGNAWTERSVLHRLYILAEESNCPNSSEMLTGAEFIIPKETVFGCYDGNPKFAGVFKSLHKFDILRSFRGYTLALSEAYAKTLLKEAKADVDIVLDSGDDIYVVVEPLGDTISLTIDMVRISADRLMGLLCISQGKESRLMPVENAYSFSGCCLFDSSYEDQANSTWHALNDTAREHSWSWEEASHLLDNPDLQSIRPDLDLLKIFRTRPLGNLYADILKQYLADESVLPDDESEAVDKVVKIDVNSSKVNPSLDLNNMELQEKAASCEGERVSAEEKLAMLFDSVTIQCIAKMFRCDDGKWEKWAERAKNNGLISARTARGKFNPYLVALWFLTKGENDWDLARCRRTLASNLPSRSRYQKHLLIDE